MSYCRSIVFTLNNYTPEEVEIIKNIKFSYIVFGYEVGESGTPHLQGYIEFSRSVRFSTIKKQMPRAHIEPRKGTPLEAATYCKKDNNFYEAGSISKQGERKDLEAAISEISSGVSADSYALTSPEFFHQYGRTLSKAEDLYRRKQFRTEMTQGFWYWGKTGVGKSHIAFKDFHPDTHYLWKNDGGWQDGYTQQETVIINDFRGEIPYNELLQLIDKWPYTLRRRGREPMPFTSKKVIITSSLPPEAVYNRRLQEDCIEQLTRRLTVSQVLGGNTKTPSLLEPQ